jgi:hypothetical protein
VSTRNALLLLLLLLQTHVVQHHPQRTPWNVGDVLLLW